MTWFERFGIWFRYELSSFNFIWNIMMMACTDGIWFFFMMIYFGLKFHFKKRRAKEFAGGLDKLRIGRDVDQDLGKDIVQDEGPDA